MTKIYLDNAATTFLDPSVREQMIELMSAPMANPSAIHSLGVKANIHIERSRKIIANLLNASPEEIVFTSSGTESNNLALKGFLSRSLSHQQNARVVTTSVEHPSILAPLKDLEERGLDVVKAKVNALGELDLEHFKTLLTPQTVLASVMHANNETGKLNNLQEIAALCQERKIPLHVDACQTFTKVPIDLSSLSIDLLTVSAHKIHGPHGVAALYVRKGTALAPILHGGGQENNLRSSTYNPIGIVGFACAAQASAQFDYETLRPLKNLFYEKLCQTNLNIHLNGDLHLSLPHIINLYVQGLDAKKLMHELDKRGFIVSAGSACHSGKKAPSPVLLAMGYDNERASESLRISMSKWSTKDELEKLSSAIIELATQSIGVSA